MWTWSLKGSGFSVVWDSLEESVWARVMVTFWSEFECGLFLLCFVFIDYLRSWQLSLGLTVHCFSFPTELVRFQVFLDLIIIFWYLTLCFNVPIVSNKECILFKKSYSNNHFTFWFFSNLTLLLTSFNIRSVQGFLWCQVPGIRTKVSMCVLMASMFLICVF